MAAVDLLPPNATGAERAFSKAGDLFDRMDQAGIAGMRGFKFTGTPAAFYPFLVYEYGLGSVSAYHASHADLIAEGIDWQRSRGTPAAILRALGWIGYGVPALVDLYPSRRFWTRYMIDMGELPPAGEEDPVLYDAEYLAGLSDPARSRFVRGFSGYDVRALQWGDGAWGDTIWGDDSGVRMPDGDVKWSHGRDHSGSVALTAAQKTELLLDIQDGDILTWTDLPWNAPGVTWNGVTDAALLKAWLVERMPAYIGFYDAADEPIGYRRAISLKDVTDQNPPVAGTSYLEATCRTGFGEGFGSVAAAVRVLFHARPADASKPGRLWLEPGEIETDPQFNEADARTDAVAMPIEFARTVREHITITVEV